MAARRSRAGAPPRAGRGEPWTLADTEEVESDLRHPPLRASERSLEAHFRAMVGLARRPLRNPHHEPRVTPAERRGAAPAAVLIPILLREPEPTLLLTRRHEAISFPGHVAFPGGRRDASDRTPEETALREAEEEIGLPRGHVRVLGRLGEYVTHSGFCIDPVVGLVRPPVELTPCPTEVEEILELPLRRALDARSYRLRRVRGPEPRAYFFLEHEGWIVAGPTVSLLIGLYEELLASHAP